MFEIELNQSSAPVQTLICYDPTCISLSGTQRQKQQEEVNAE